MPANRLGLSTPKVTIAIPVFNGANYLAEAIESALCQTYADREVLVVDDGSTDGGETARIARSFEPHIRYIHQDNGGVSAALNTAIRNMQGDAFAWLSHDDLHEPEKTAVQVDFFLRLGSPTACFFSDFRWIDPGGVITSEQRYDVGLLRRSPALAFFECMINGCTTFIPRCVLEAVGFFSVEHRYTQDYRMWWTIERRFGFLHLPMLLARIRRHPDQGSVKPAFLAEGEAFWDAVLDSANVIDHGAAGSSERFYHRMGRFLLERSPNRKAAHHAFEKANTARRTVQASAILLARSVAGACAESDEKPGAALLRSACSALDQGHHLAELIIILSATDMPDDELIRKVAASNKRLRIVRSGDTLGFRGWTAGLLHARAEYAAFLMEGDTWLPGKLATQLTDTVRRGSLLSHTSYRIASDAPEGVREIASGHFAGFVYPEIIGQPIIAPSTLVVHRSLVARGWTLEVGREHFSLVEAAVRYSIAGVTNVLSELACDPFCDANRVADRLAFDLQHGRHRNALDRLRSGARRALLS